MKKDKQQTAWSDKCRARYPNIGSYADTTMGGFWHPDRTEFDRSVYEWPQDRRPPR